MNYQQTIDYLFSRLPLFSRIGAAAYKADLTNTIELCKALGDPQKTFKSIHIAGTNGKGSVSHMLASICQEAGYKTGLYTSPHLKDFRERIKINGNVVDESFVISFTEKIRPLIEKLEPSFFEITVAMAFEYFSTSKIDIAIIEAGLGGRLDSTNIITPELSVITNIGYDHMNILGNTLELIAKEKAGIIKPQVPVVIGEVLQETEPVFTTVATEKNAPLSIASQKRQVMDWRWVNHQLVTEVADQHHSDHEIYQLDLPGIYQTKNLLTVLEACSILREQGWNIFENEIANGLKDVKKLTGLHGRWEIVHTRPLIVLDVAHNQDGIRQLLQQVELTDHDQLWFIMGMVKDKDVETIMSLLPRDAKYCFTKAQIPRALPEEELAGIASRFGLEGETFTDVNAAIIATLESAKPNDLIIVCGSVFVVGEVNLLKT